MPIGYVSGSPSVIWSHFTFMRFAFSRCDTIPRLGWCAPLRRGSGVAHVYHGPWVETRDDWFVEGAWTGQFEIGELDDALFLVGSGGVVRNTISSHR